MKESAKHIIEGVIVLLIVLFIFSYLTDPWMRYRVESVVHGFGADLEQTIDNIPTPSMANCENLAMQMIPDNLTYIINGSYLVRYSDVGCVNSFDDGSKIDKCKDFHYRKGTEKGENINYFYHFSFSAFFDETGSIPYSKSIIDSKGNILGDRKFNFNPVIEKIPGTEEHHESINMEWTTQQFEIVNPNITSCHWITDEGEVIA